MSLFAVASALSVGFLLGLLGLGVYVSFRIIKYPDLTVEGAFVLGATVTIAVIQHGWSAAIATLAGVAAAATAGYCTAFQSSRLNIHPVVAGILTSTACYSVALLVLHAPNISVTGDRTLFASVEMLRATSESAWTLFASPVVFLLTLLMVKFGVDRLLQSEAGMVLRATGSNAAMATAQGIDPGAATRRGLMLANGIVGLSGALFAQAEHFGDVNMGLGMLVVGLAAVFIGEAIERRLPYVRGIAASTTAVMIGSVLHRFAIAAVYEFGLPTDYFNVVTSLIVLAALLMPGAREQLLVVLRRAV